VVLGGLWLGRLALPLAAGRAVPIPGGRA
jgi:hypothetical protein